MKHCTLKKPRRHLSTNAMLQYANTIDITVGMFKLQRFHKHLNMEDEQCTKKLKTFGVCDSSLLSLFVVLGQ